jgi:hypothetical protein
MSAAIFFWSADLTSGVGGARWVGLAGLAAGLFPVAATLSMGGLSTGAMMLALASWVVWLIAVGSLMIQRRV